MHKSYLWLAGMVLVGSLMGVAAAAYMAKNNTAAAGASAPAAG